MTDAVKRKGCTSEAALLWQLTRGLIASTRRGQRLTPGWQQRSENRAAGRVGIEQWDSGAAATRVRVEVMALVLGDGGPLGKDVREGKGG